MLILGTSPKKGSVGELRRGIFKQSPESKRYKDEQNIF